MHNKSLNVVVILLLLLAFSVNSADAKVIDFKEVYQDYLGNWYKYDAINIAQHPFYLKTENSTHYILSRIDDTLIINKSIIYNGSFSFGATDISFIIVAPVSKVQTISQSNGTDIRRIKIPESVKNTYKKFTWDNKLPVVILKNQTWNMTVLQSDYWYSRQNGNLWFNFKTVNVSGLPADVNASFYFTTWIVDNATTSGWSTTNVSLNGSRWTNDGSLAINLRNDSQLNMSGLIAYWSADEKTGTIWHQVNTESGLVNTTNQGTWYGNTTLNYSVGKIGNAITFDGVNDYVNVGNAASLNGITGNLSIECWINPKSYGSPDSTILSKGGTGNNYYQQYSIGLSGSGLGIYIGNSTNNGYFLELVTATSISLNQWTHFVFTLSGTSGVVYINGAQNNTAATSGARTTNTYNVLIGQRGTTGFPLFFNGTIDEVHIYNRALSSSEIAIAYNTSIRTQAMPVILNQTAQAGNVINRTRITYTGQDSINNASIYARQNGTTTWTLIQLNVTSNTWYPTSTQFNVMDFAVMMQGNGNNTPFFSCLEWDETVSATPTPTLTPTPTPFNMTSTNFNLTTNNTYAFINSTNNTLQITLSNSSYLLVYPYNQELIVVLLSIIAFCLCFIVIYILYKEVMR